LYFLDNRAPARAKTIRPSARGEIEITALLEIYLAEGSLTVAKLGRGYAWLDTGTHGSLLDAGNFVRTLQERQGLLVGSPDEIALENKWIARASLKEISKKFGKNQYSKYFLSKI
jgi:glucose-1-phosphate thymidylyltransferase